MAILAACVSEIGRGLRFVVPPIVIQVHTGFILFYLVVYRVQPE